MSTRVTSFTNIGHRCGALLAAIGVHTAEDLKQKGVPIAYRDLIPNGIVGPRPMLLCAFGGAMSGESCMTSRDQKHELEEASGLGP